MVKQYILYVKIDIESVGEYDGWVTMWVWIKDQWNTPTLVEMHSQWPTLTLTPTATLITELLQLIIPQKNNSLLINMYRLESYEAVLNPGKSLGRDNKRICPADLWHWPIKHYPSLIENKVGYLLFYIIKIAILFIYWKNKDKSTFKKIYNKQKYVAWSLNLIINYTAL